MKQEAFPEDARSQLGRFSATVTGLWRSDGHGQAGQHHQYLSMASTLLTRVIVYSAAKAGMEITLHAGWPLTWRKKYGEGIRVDAIAPGFFVSEQNRNFCSADSAHPARPTDHRPRHGSALSRMS
ncbi:MAG: hypothetical protein R2932_46160 [Caldilineaceae bacterium]